jgi:calcium permeable stress-gated cation channel
VDKQFDNAGFILFANVKGAHSASRYIRSNPTLLAQTNFASFKICPPFQDIIWDNIGITPTEKYSRRVLTFGLWIVLAFSWTAITAAISSLSNLQVLFKSNQSALNWLAANKTFVLFWTSVVVPSLLAVATALLPIVLTFLSKIQGVKSEQGVQKSVLYKHFGFQVITTLSVTLTGFVEGLVTSTYTAGLPITDRLKVQVVASIQGFTNVMNSPLLPLTFISKLMFVAGFYI